jgi:hypothetical protein
MMPLSRKPEMKVHQKRLLDKGKSAKLVATLRSLHSRNPEVADNIRTEADYFARNALRMRYPQFRRQHLFVGSGVIEAARPSLAPVLSSPACFGPFTGPTPFYPSVAVTSMAASRTTGRPARPLDWHF